MKTGILTLVCRKCTRFENFEAITAQEAHDKAFKRGWLERNGSAICPRCSGGGK